MPPRHCQAREKRLFLLNKLKFNAKGFVIEAKSCQSALRSDFCFCDVTSLIMKGMNERYFGNAMMQWSSAKKYGRDGEAKYYYSQVVYFVSLDLYQQYKMQDQQKNCDLSETKMTIYTEDDVLEFKKQLESKTGSKLDLSKPSPFQIMLTCRNLDKYFCGFKYLFRKCDEDPEKAEYILFTQFESHHLQCLSQTSKDSKSKSDILSSPSFKRYKPEAEISQQPFSPKLFILAERAISDNKSQPKENQLIQECIFLQKKHSSRFYTQDEVGALKKQLQFQSKGLISKSTQFHPELGYISKISFKCKYENANCPYLATLTYLHERNEKSQKLYRLNKVNISHTNGCILDDQEVFFNFITRKIDENFPVLMKILQENSSDIKPKKVLELFALHLGEEIDFIYKGISSKNNKRAAKKYFDNSVAKARNMLKEKSG